MKIIKYQHMTEVNHGTEEEPNIVKSFHDCDIRCADEYFEANYAIAQSEAYNGEVTVEEVEDPETPVPSGGDSSVWDELDAAYQEGVDSV
jgi:hypothetical protein